MSIDSLILCAATMMGASGAHMLTPPDFDRWNYPFNATPGSRSVGSTFSAYGSEYDFDNRDGQVLLGWLTSDVVDAGWPAFAYDVTACTVTVTIASDDVPYDPTQDAPATYMDGGDDTDEGRPTVLSAVGFRNGWDAFTFGDDGAFGSTDAGTRNCYAADFDAQGQLRDISNSLTEGFQPNVFAVASSNAVAPGEVMPQFTVLTFEVDVTDEHIQCWLRQGVAQGLVEFMVTSLHSASEPGSGGGGVWPDWVLAEHALVGMGLIDAATITLTVDLVEPSGVPGDINGDGLVGIDDLLELLSNYGPCPCCASDLDGSGVVDVDDLLTLIGGWTS